MFTVLIVDDDPGMRRMLVEQLECAGYRAAAAAGFDDALSSLDGGGVDAVLSDIQMPGRTGFDLLRSVHQLRPDLPVILMTSFASAAIAERAKEAGAFAFLSKPFDDGQLLEVLERIQLNP